MRVPAALLLFCASALAAPPESPGFKRMDDLRHLLADRGQELAAREEYASKPRIEKIIISFRRGDAKFERHELTGEWTVKQLLEWPEAKKAEATQEAVRVLDVMRDALEQRYAKQVDYPKRDRYKASLLLVKTLTHERLHVRKFAIESLMKIYRKDTSLFYQPDASGGERRKRQKSWKTFVEREKNK